MEIPKDIVSSGHTDIECFAIFYGATEEEVLKKRKNYLERYPTMGYSTFTDIQPTKHSNGYWFCKMKRWRSCK